MSSLVKRLPNWITYIRLGLIPVFVVLMRDPSQRMVSFAVTVFIIAAITDFLDGMIARRYSAISDLGKLLDPLADKVLVMAALVMLVSQRSDLNGEPWVQGWMVVIVLARELWVTGLRGIAAKRGIVVAASEGGKVKSVLQMVAIVFLLLHQKPINIGGLRVSAQFIGVDLLFVSLAASIWSAAQYTMQIFVATKGFQDPVE